MPPTSPPPVIEFSVSYALGEYLSIVRDHIPRALADYEAQRGKPLTRQPEAVGRWMVPVASAMFFFKKMRMPVCHFVIDADGIRRETRLGRLEVPWAEVVAVHRYTQGYLIEKASGALPLPYRCLSPGQRAIFEGFIALPPRR